LARRSRYEIYQDTLETIRRRGAQGITRISYGANMPVDRANEIVDLLTKRGLVKHEEYGNVMGYRLTARGGEFLQALRKVKDYLEDG
jgi:predicted transcriptional regulator